MIDYEQIIGRGVVGFIDGLNNKEAYNMLNQLESEIKLCKDTKHYMLKSRIIEKRYITSHIRGL